MTELLNIHPHCPLGALLLFLALVIGHALADFPLQGAFLSETKNRHRKIAGQSENGAPPVNWVHSLSAHALIHCGAVWLVTGSAILGLAEFVLHWLIDFAKCEKWTGFSADQFLHYLCKAVYVALIYYGVVEI